MSKIYVAKCYLAALRSADAEAATALFLEDGAIDDFVGGHRVGRRGIEELFRQVKATPVFVSEPEHWIEEGNRLAVYGYLGLADGETRDRVRWIFHFEGARISHLGNTRVDHFP